ncbi:hypothetical protein KBB27_01925 [Patescibacteria group bacterium]|nr:hypothetical protein [Patescibacteria group bacterium]
MQSLSDVLKRIRATKKERKTINDAYKDVLSQSKTYQNVIDQIDELRAKKAKIEADTRQDFVNEFERAGRLAENLKADAQLLTDIALSKFMKGETVEVTDENDTKYEPVFKITFKKSN